MTALIVKMVLCLVVALVLGFLIGWFLSKALRKEQENLASDDLYSTIEVQKEQIEKLEKQYADEKLLVTQYNDQNRELKGKLLQKINLLKDKSDTLLELQNKLQSSSPTKNDTIELREKNYTLVKQMEALHVAAEKKEKEIEEFESVLIKAEETIEIKEKCCKVLEDKLAEYTSTKVDDELLISKDQFTQIENKLVEYQTRIDVLKKENEALGGKSLKRKNGISELDDLSIVKLFRDTYKKITKS
ncbi:MAG: hypothetical protein KU29_03215 [Sulfurovum sp. FS06-10]|nr:MAG: hypothetical protein KU29_03215 [Sulfurovum sp. FS06-10]